MKDTPRKPALTLALTACLAGAWSQDVSACAEEPYLTSICIMAWQFAPSGFEEDAYLPANGRKLPVRDYMDLYTLIGNTYGGNNVDFQLPDLMGRVVVGAGKFTVEGKGEITYGVGKQGGQPSQTLNANQLPEHEHSLESVNTTVATDKIVTKITLSDLIVSTGLSGVTATASGSGLTLNSAQGGTPTNEPKEAAIALLPPKARFYAANSTPSVAMRAGSIGGEAAVTLKGEATATVKGVAKTKLSLSGMRIKGETGLAGGQTPVQTMPPYLPMTYYIAVRGTHPLQD